VQCLLVAAATQLTDEKPIRIKRLPDGTPLIDFGRVAFGHIRITPTGTSAHDLTVHFGEAFANGRIERNAAWIGALCTDHHFGEWS